MGVSPDLLGKASQLMNVRAQRGDEKKVSFLFAELAQKLRLAHPSTAIQNVELGSPRLMQLAKLGYFRFPVEENAILPSSENTNQDYHNPDL